MKTQENSGANMLNLQPNVVEKSVLAPPCDLCFCASARKKLGEIVKEARAESFI